MAEPKLQEQTKEKSREGASPLGDHPGKIKNSPEMNFDETNSETDAQLLGDKRASDFDFHSSVIESIEQFETNDHYIFAGAGGEKFVGKFVAQIAAHTIDFQPMHTGQYLATRSVGFDDYTVSRIEEGDLNALSTKYPWSEA